ncbi:MAG: YggU family protein [Chitinivibrionales bacterium]|nr:YggU family protein [Chitinivibrionales bacterium]
MTVSCTLEIKLKPRAKKDRLICVSAERIELAITALPVDGKANAYLCKLLSTWLRIAQSNIEIIRGGKARIKIIKITGLSPDAVHHKLKALTL